MSSGISGGGNGVPELYPVNLFRVRLGFPREGCTPFSSGLSCPSNGLADRPSLVWEVDPPTPLNPPEREEGRTGRERGWDGQSVSNASLSQDGITGM